MRPKVATLAAGLGPEQCYLFGFAFTSFFGSERYIFPEISHRFGVFRHFLFFNEYFQFFSENSLFDIYLF